MTTIPDFGQAHKTCGGVKLVVGSQTSPNKWSKEIPKKTYAIAKDKINPIRLEIHVYT